MARIRTRWWEDRLFLAIGVSDDVVTGDDRIEVAIDGRDNDTGGGDDDPVFQFFADGRTVADGVAIVHAIRIRIRGL